MAHNIGEHIVDVQLHTDVTVSLKVSVSSPDQDKEEAYRRENYMIFQKNLAEAFNQYNKDGNEYLDREEFKNFMIETLGDSIHPGKLEELL